VIFLGQVYRGWPPPAPQVLPSAPQVITCYHCPDVSVTQVGRTKIFFRPGVLGFVEDKWAAMQSAALRIQVGNRSSPACLPAFCLPEVSLLPGSCWHIQRTQVVPPVLSSCAVHPCKGYASWVTNMHAPADLVCFQDQLPMILMPATHIFPAVAETPCLPPCPCMSSSTESLGGTTARVAVPAFPAIAPHVVLSHAA
jgi:hypothetical protein